MNYANIEIVILGTCFALVMAALLVVFRAPRTRLSLEDFEMLRAMIRAEIADMQSDAKQRELSDALAEKYVSALRDLG